MARPASPTRRASSISAAPRPHPMSEGPLTESNVEFRDETFGDRLKELDSDRVVVGRESIEQVRHFRSRVHEVIVAASSPARRMPFRERRRPRGFVDFPMFPRVSRVVSCYPPENRSLPAWNNTTKYTATARNPSKYGRYPSRPVAGGATPTAVDPSPALCWARRIDDRVCADTRASRVLLTFGASVAFHP